MHSGCAPDGPERAVGMAETSLKVRFGAPLLMFVRAEEEGVLAKQKLFIQLVFLCVYLLLSPTLE